MKIAIVCALLSVAPFLSLGSEDETLKKCNELYEQWGKDLTSFQSKCMIEESATMMIHFNCESHQCIQQAVDLRLQFNDNLKGMCQMEANEFKVKQEDNEFLEKLTENMKKCNTCITKYTEFGKVYQSLFDNNCHSSLTHSFPEDTCSQKCIDIRTNVNTLFYELFGKACHQYMPGGCGEGGGMTEGEVYDALQAQESEMLSLQASNLLCSPQCKESLTSWYSGLAQNLVDGCLSSKSNDLQAQDIPFTAFVLSPSCSNECVSKVQESISKTYLMELDCKNGGLVPHHINELSQSINDKSCNRNTSSNQLSSNSAKGFLTLAVLVCAVVSIYFIVRCVKKRSKQTETNSTLMKQGLPKQTEMRSRSDDAVLIYGDDDEDEI